MKTLFSQETFFSLGFLIYAGIGLTFWSGVYGTCLGRTQKFSNAKSLVPMHGITMGIGEIIGGLAFGIFGRYLDPFIGRTPRYVLGRI